MTCITSSSRTTQNSATRGFSSPDPKAFAMVTLLMLSSVSWARDFSERVCVDGNHSFSNDDRCLCSSRITEVQNLIERTLHELGVKEHLNFHSLVIEGIPVNMPLERLNEEWQSIAGVVGGFQNDLTELTRAHWRSSRYDNVNVDHYYSDLINEKQIELLSYTVESIEIAKKIFPKFEYPPGGWTFPDEIGSARTLLHQAKGVQAEHNKALCKRLWKLQQSNCQIFKIDMDRWNAARFTKKMKKTR